MTDPRRLCHVADVPDEGALGIDREIDGQPFALILLRRGGEVFAYHNECPHAGRRLEFAPGRFMVSDQKLMCAVHGATFTVGDGECCGGPARSGLVAQAIRVADGVVWMDD